MALGTDYLLKYKIVADAYAAKAEIKSLDDAFGAVGKKAATSLGSLAAPAGLAVSAIAGVTTALFGLTKEAAEYGQTIYLASAKTGLHAETLTAMNLAAKQSGLELDQVTKSVSKFSIQIDAAAQGSKEATAMLTRFGLTPKAAINDLDGALGKVFKKIADTKNINEQAGLAAAAFGKKIGTQLLPFIKQFDGNLPGLIQKAKELGVTMSDQDAAAAHEFTDQMDKLSIQVGAASRKIGGEFMTAFTHMAEDVSDWLSKNQDETKTWADSFAQYLDDLGFKLVEFSIGMRRVAAEVSAFFHGASSDEIWNIGVQFDKESERHLYGATHEQMGPYASEMNRPDTKADTAYQEKIKAAKASKADKIGDAAPSKRAVEVLKAVIAPSKFDAAMKEAAAQVSKETGIDEDIVFTMLKATVFRESSGVGGQTSSAGAKGLTQQLAGTSKRLGPGNEFVKAARYLTRGFGGEGYEAGGAKEAFATYFAGGSGAQRGAKTKAYVTDQSWVFEHAKQILDGLDKVAKKDKETSDESVKNAEDAAQRKAEIGQTFAESMVELLQQEYESSLKYNDFDGAIKAAKDAHDQTVQNVEDEIAELERKAAATKADSDEEKRANDAVTLAKIKGDKAIRDADAELAKNIEEVQGRQADLFIDITQNAEKAKDAIDRLGTGMAELIGQGDAAGATTKFEGTFKKDHSIIDRIFGNADDMKSDVDVRKQMIGDLADFAGNAFGQMASAVGSAVEAWVLYGDSIGSSLKKATASVLAQLAAQATVKAIFELAEGFASLAVGDFYGASQHFTSAAIFGTLAAGAAIAGRAVAGDSFKSGAKGSAAPGSAGGTSATGSASNAPLVPYSRSGPDTFISGSRNGLVDAINRNTQATEALHAKIGSMKPGDVVTVGAKQRPDVIGKAVVTSMGRNSSIGKQMAIRQGQR